MRKKTNEEFQNEINLKFHNISCLGVYNGAKHKIDFLCNSCKNIWSASPTNILTGYGCPKCAGNIQLNHSEYLSQIKKLYGDRYKIIGEYVKAKEPIETKHIECGYVWKISPDNLKRGRGCPNCSGKSKGEKFISEILQENNINFIREHVIADRKRFDFAILNDKWEIEFLIEYDGIQHYEFNNNGWFSNAHLEDIQKSDKLKTNQAKNSNIKLYRIPYWNFSKIKYIIESIVKFHNLI